MKDFWENLQVGTTSVFSVYIVELTFFYTNIEIDLIELASPEDTLKDVKYLVSLLCLFGSYSPLQFDWFPWDKYLSKQLIRACFNSEDG